MNEQTTEQPITSSTWTIDVSPKGVQLTRWHAGRIDEVYATVPHAIGVIYCAAVIQGYNPPRQSLTPLEPCFTQP